MNAFDTFIADLPAEDTTPIDTDWLVEGVSQPAVVSRSADAHNTISLSNGLIRRAFRLNPNGATVAFDNLVTGDSILRAVSPEARVRIDGEDLDVGGLVGQPEFGYLRREWVETMTSPANALQLVGIETGQTMPPFQWRRCRHHGDQPWPPPGVRLTMHYAQSNGAGPGDSSDRASSEAAAEVTVHYELYDGVPVLAKWLEIRNTTDRPLRVEQFSVECLAVVDYESCVEGQKGWPYPGLHVESDYAFHGMTARSADVTTCWLPDPRYTSQVSYLLESPLLLETRPPLGPDTELAPGDTLTSFRTFLVCPDSTERERRGLALRRFYRTVAPWTTENPILMHVRHADPESVKAAIDQCEDVGFEMVILTFGSGFDAENEEEAYLDELKELADYAHERGIELGGYSLLASRAVSDTDDIIDPDSGERGHGAFGNSPCLESAWGQDYFRKLEQLYEHTGLDILEHDGSYPGDVCASTDHPGHRGLADSQWTQWLRITAFYRWCRERGIYLNVPDWYFLNGSNKNGMGYREVNWSLPREQQIILGRQNIYDGTWEKSPSMGWMFVPLVEYHGGGEAATLEPLHDHLDAYEAHLAQNFGAGVQACYRGARLYDTDRTRTVVKKWVDFYKKYRQILEADIIHLRRPDARDLDGFLHVDPFGDVRGLAMVFNPLDVEVTRSWRLPLYYTGLSDVALIREQEGSGQRYAVAPDGSVTLDVRVPANGVTWFVVEAG
ncbi:MAG: alpha-galactosidase [Gemmatimonadetes bacterium]|nr:alpha-galactosidase [Gemmatimonadota bacterium]MBT7863666.1 alpha-galactosidase [Gemmatimonadota bacterium]